MVKFIPILALSLAFLTGCISKTTINPVYPFEGRYSDRTNLVIDGQKVPIPNGKSVWILTNETLFNLLDNTKNK